jgi:hypothetical protein
VSCYHPADGVLEPAAGRPVLGQTVEAAYALVQAILACVDHNRLHRAHAPDQERSIRLSKLRTTGMAAPEMCPRCLLMNARTQFPGYYWNLRHSRPALTRQHRSTQRRLFAYGKIYTDRSSEMGSSSPVRPSSQCARSSSKSVLDKEHRESQVRQIRRPSRRRDAGKRERTR